MQPGDKHQHILEHLSPKRNIGNLERDVANMPDDLLADLDELLLEAVRFCSAI
jgi:hypothetical protein